MDGDESQAVCIRVTGISWRTEELFGPEDGEIGIGGGDEGVARAIRFRGGQGWR